MKREGALLNVSGYLIKEGYNEVGFNSFPCDIS